MPTAYGLNAAKFLDAAVPPAQRSAVAGGAYGGGLYLIDDEFTVVAGQPGSAQNDVLVMGKAPQGLTVIDCVLSWGVLGTGVTLSYGTDNLAARFVSAVAAAAAGVGRLGVAAGHGYVFDADRLLWVTIGGAAPAAGIKIRSTLICMHT